MEKLSKAEFFRRIDKKVFCFIHPKATNGTRLLLKHIQLEKVEKIIADPLLGDAFFITQDKQRAMAYLIYDFKYHPILAEKFIVSAIETPFDDWLRC